MKKITYALLVAVVAMSMMVLCSCGGSSLGITGNSEKSMTIEAKNAAQGDYVLTGGLEVTEGEQVVIASSLEKGELKIELYATPAEQSAEEMPDVEGSEPVVMSNASGTETVSATVPEGSYMVKVTSVEKATGTVQIDVTPAE